MLKVSTRERLEKLAVLFLCLLLLLSLSGFFFISSKLEFDRNSAQFRETKVFLGIPYHTSTRETWLTQFQTFETLSWERVSYGSSGRSVWHGVAGKFNADIRGLESYDKFGFLSESSRTAIAQAINDILVQPGDIHDNLTAAAAWFECFLWELPLPDDTDDTVSNEAVFQLLQRCNTETHD